MPNLAIRLSKRVAPFLSVMYPTCTGPSRGRLSRRRSLAKHDKNRDDLPSFQLNSGQKMRRWAYTSINFLVCLRCGDGSFDGTTSGRLAFKIHPKNLPLVVAPSLRAHRS